MYSIKNKKSKSILKGFSPGLIAVSLDYQLLRIYRQRNEIFNPSYTNDLFYLAFLYGHIFKHKCMTDGCDPLNFSSEFLSAKKESLRSIPRISTLYYIQYFLNKASKKK
jgi:hypothetical protein